MKSMSRAPVYVVALALLVSGCSKNPKNHKITEANKSTFMEEIKTQEGLTVEEMGLLVSYQMRSAMGSSFGGAGAASPVGKTVGQIIEEERKLQADVKAREQEQERLAKEAKAKEDARVEELRKALLFSVFEKDVRYENPAAGRYRDEVVVRCAFENISPKDIRAFKGTVVFTDLFGAQIYQSGVTIQEAVKAGQKGNWTGVIELNQFDQEDRRLRDTPLSNMKVVWRPDSIIFTDGTTLNASGQ